MYLPFHVKMRSIYHIATIRWYKSTRYKGCVVILLVLPDIEHDGAEMSFQLFIIEPEYRDGWRFHMR